LLSSIGLLKRLLPLVLFIAIVPAAVGPIRNYDFFWHLATGRWIAEHRALPLTDPFAVASDRGEWVNGEWLFEVVLHGFERVLGIAGLSWLRALFIAALFTLVLRFSENLLLTALAFAGAMPVIDLRPSGVAALFVVLAIAVARKNNAILYAVLTVLWINVHPSALLAPVIALLLTRKVPITLASVVALLVNPYGIYGVLAPLRLLTFVGSGTFVNAEWLPSAPLTFPLLYASIAIAAVVFAMKREDPGRVLLALLLAFLAVRHVRNQPLWFAAFPLLVAPSMRAIPRALEYVASAALLAFVAIRGDHRLGVSPFRFPLQAVARLKASGLRGNVYNPDQFGGFLIWSFYPERRTLTDGRNELYRAFIPEYARARLDQRAWRELLRRYRIDLAVDEYRPPLDVMNGVTRQRTKMPASLAYWPRQQWALIAFDRAAMVFARRDAFSREQLAQWEIRGVVPDTLDGRAR